VHKCDKMVGVVSNMGGRGLRSGLYYLPS
jgi:hypothetical protein